MPVEFPVPTEADPLIAPSEGAGDTVGLDNVVTEQDYTAVPQPQVDNWVE
jgi:hypothetical protein